MHITPELLLHAYAAGIFPMAEDAQATELMWFDPPQRGILPLDAMHVPRRLRRMIRKRSFHVTMNKAFSAVMAACAAPTATRRVTWINQEIILLYTALHETGYAHSLEVWNGKELVGGLYGVALGGAFFGESMFSRTPDASKTALVTLVALLRKHGFSLLDCQSMTEHLAQFGVVEISRAAYHQRLKAALPRNVSLQGAGEDTSGLDALVEEFLQSVTQTS